MNAPTLSHFSFAAVTLWPRADTIWVQGSLVPSVTLSRASISRGSLVKILPRRPVFSFSRLFDQTGSMKKPFYNPFVTVSTVLAVIRTIPAFGGSKKKKATPVYHTPVISSVTGNAITVSEEKTTRRFIITQFTEINVNGQRATIVDLKPGVTVSVTIGMDPTRASRVVAKVFQWAEIEKRTEDALNGRFHESKHSGGIKK
jgi:hypothetical protein